MNSSEEKMRKEIMFNKIRFFSMSAIYIEYVNQPNAPIHKESFKIAELQNVTEGRNKMPIAKALWYFGYCL